MSKDCTVLVWKLCLLLSSTKLENLIRLVREMSIKDCREGDLESITVVGNMEDSTMKANQDGVLTIVENEEAESISGNKVKRSRKLTEKGFQYKLEQLKTKREKINAKLLRKSGMMNDAILIYKCICSCRGDGVVQ